MSIMVVKTNSPTPYGFYLGEGLRLTPEVYVDYSALVDSSQRAFLSAMEGTGRQPPSRPGPGY